MTDESFLRDLVDLRQVEREILGTVSLCVREASVHGSNDLDPDGVSVEILVFLPGDGISPLGDSGVP